MMPIEDVLKEMREWEQRDYPLIGAWADAFEKAMLEASRESLREHMSVVRELLREREAKEAEIEKLRETLEDASEALDLAQAMLERSSHHARILGAYDRTRAALNTEDK